MSVVPRRVSAMLLLRSFVVQGSWNYETLIGTGFAFVLLPALRLAHRGDPPALEAALRRHAELFNSHPYLAGIAVGAVARLEAEHADPALIARFKSALRSSLGSIGDQLIWLAWRPACALLALALLLAGAPWWVGGVVFLLTYNALHLHLRAWGLRVGTRNGLQVGRVLREAPLQGWAGRASDAGALLAGFAAVVAATRAAPAPDLSLLPLLLAVPLGWWLGPHSRRAGWIGLSAAWLVGLLLGAFLG